MAKPKLHLDADASQKALLDALLQRGHDVTRTPQNDLPFDADDDIQLLWATAQGRIIFTHNIRDFIRKTEQYPQHSGILLALGLEKRVMSLSSTVKSLSRTSREKS